MIKKFLAFLLLTVNCFLVFSYEPEFRPPEFDREPTLKQRIKIREIEKVNNYSKKLERTDKYFEEFEDNGTHTFLCSMSFLYYNKLNEEVRIQNNSSYKLRNVRCTISIQKREHDLKNIKEIEIGETEEFDGYEDDELKDELKHYYGKEVGKISADNPNTITFKLNFNDYNEKVLIKKVYNEDKSLSFEIVDNPNHKRPVEQA